jgi:carbonic anhydrase/acetyltransferase-like protein (isoleucine patch superfamily)
MDLADFLRFHCETQSPITEAQDDRGQLGVCLFDHHGTDEPHDSYGSATGWRMPYQFRGYAKRILSAKERQELVGDGLTGACAMRPLGTQIREQVWVGEGVNLAASARVIGPTFIGARTTVRAGATIGPYASVERDCVVDCGTAVQHSTVLPHTYLAPGLLIRHALVDGRYLEDLESAAVADLKPAGLGNSILREESRRHPFDEQAIDAFARAGGGWSFAPFSTASQPWLQVQL